MRARRKKRADMSAALHMRQSQRGAEVFDSAAVCSGERKYKDIFDHALEGIFQSRLCGGCLDVNPAMAAMFGYASSEQMLGEITDVGRQLVANPHDWDAVLELAREQGSVSGREILLRRKDSATFYGMLSGRIVGLGKDDAYFEGFLQDLTERKIWESHLVQIQKLEAIGQLSAGIAHEINTPSQYVLNNMHFIKDGLDRLSQAVAAQKDFLTSLEGYAELEDSLARMKALGQELQLDFYLEEMPGAVAESLQGLERITAIVRSIKQFAHPSHDTHQHVDVNELVENAVIVSRNEWKYVADLSMELDPDLPAVPCAAQELGQVLLNLIVNASQAIAEVRPAGQGKGRIVVSTSRQGAWIELRVQDSGPGIPEHVQPRVFDPFFTTKAIGLGTGQGLFLAHTIVVKNHGGQILFQTRAGQGTTFVVRLPAAVKGRSPE